MQYSGLDRPRGPGYFAVWKAVFVLVILGAAGLFWFAGTQIHYNWRWYRVPQYFWINDDVEVRAEVDGTVQSVEKQGGQWRIVIKPLDAEAAPAVVDLPGSGNAAVAAGADIYRGDVLGKYNRSGPGVLLKALWVTLEVSALSIVFGILLGLGAGLCRVSENPALRWLSITYIEIIRGSPLLVQIFIWYYVVGYFVDQIFRQLDLTPIPPTGYGVIALSLFTGAYVAEIVRAGIQSVHRGQTEAARSLGMTYAQSMRRVILPQALRRIMPPLAGQFISLIKDSSLLGVMSVRELTKATREATTSSMQSLEMWFTCALLYLVLTFTLSVFVQYLERRAVLR